MDFLFKIKAQRYSKSCFMYDIVEYITNDGKYPDIGSFLILALVWSGTQLSGYLDTNVLIPLAYLYRPLIPSEMLD